MMHAHTLDGYQAILPDLLDALHWGGKPRHVEEARGLQGHKGGFKEFRSMMAHLGYASTVYENKDHFKAYSSFPCVFVGKENQVLLLHRAEDVDELGKSDGLFLTFDLAEAEQGGNLTKALFKRFQPILGHVLFISLLIGLISLAPVFYNMAVYDMVLPVSSPEALGMLFIGVALALTTEIVLRRKRNKLLGYFGARLDHYVGCSVFDRLMHLPPFFTERTSISAQLARLRDFDAMREFFTGALATLFFELPLTAVYTVIMACIAGKLALIPVLLVASYVVLIWGMNGNLRDKAQKASTASSQRQEFVLETLAKLRAIRLAGMENVWMDRYETLSNETARASLRSSMTAQVIEIASYALMTMGGIATLSWGVVSVIHENMTVGALIASMILIWRIVSPLQMCCASITRIQQLLSSTDQVNKLLSLQTEQSPVKAAQLKADTMKGRVTFFRTSIRYSPEAEPALLGVSFDIKPGQVAAIRGENGSGKSSILKLILGMYQPQGGSVRLDGIDVRQYDPIALRQAIAYVPQHIDLLPGTVLDNLRYAEPTASEERCLNALQRACGLEEVERLPQGIHTRIGGEGAEAISFMLRQRIGLARAFVKPAKIILFDEASHSLGKENDEAFIKMLNDVRGHSTVIMATHREDHMRLADVLLVMKKGELVSAGAPPQILTALQGKRA